MSGKREFRTYPRSVAGYVDMSKVTGRRPTSARRRDVRHFDLSSIDIEKAGAFRISNFKTIHSKFGSLFQIQSYNKCKSNKVSCFSFAHPPSPYRRGLIR